MALLQILQFPELKIRIQLSALHIHHGVRGDGAEHDARFVADWCAARQIPLTTVELHNVKNKSETYLRRRRYQVFHNHLENNPGLYLATAHHLNDDLETMLINLFHSSGLESLRGIPAKRDRILRPLLTCSRLEIEEFLAQEKTPFCSDETNADEAILRNKIRRVLLPLLADIFAPDSQIHFRRTMQHLKADVEFVNKVLDEKFRAEVQCRDNIWRIPLQFWAGLGQSGRRFVLGFVLSKLQIDQPVLRPSGQRALELFIGQSQVGRKFSPFGRTVIFEKERTFVAVYKVMGPDPGTALLWPDQPVNWRGQRIGLREIAPDTIHFSKNPCIEYICGDRLIFPLNIRGWQAGDVFHPLNGRGGKKISDFFIDQRLSRLEKENVPLIVNDNQIVWIAGYRLDHRYRIGTECRHSYQIVLENEYAP